MSIVEDIVLFSLETIPLFGLKCILAIQQILYTQYILQ